MIESPPDRPAQRYGTRHSSRRTRRWIVVGSFVAVVALGVAVAAVAFSRLGSPEVKGELSGYRVVDDRTVEVTASVTRDDPSRPVVCIVRARSYDGDEVGRRELLVPPSATGTVQVTTRVTTSRPAVVGDVYGCGTDVPPYLVAG
ncbi:DUF4307 domain-containing protein [Mycolicibacterium sp. 018/SC-01/001]|uniref:DUF4307 domain-containing protein n=1 Tax=Mycolicibacterium sp. 018/SC-01/001 TaxID=2592069 RepID=UPI00117D994D|nr:DUF4307 domain-containing protein [Mycolicibacterium sp. 018/SC-01/001]TRW78390.1 DUF4307 domain-containing protein [Mycolicibacterium sp. 018/SC-01/001]